MEDLIKQLRKIADNITLALNEVLYGTAYEEKKHGVEARQNHRNLIKALSLRYRSITHDDVIDAEALELYGKLLSYGMYRHDLEEIGEQYALGKIQLKRDKKSDV